MSSPAVRQDPSENEITRVCLKHKFKTDPKIMTKEVGYP